LIDAICENPKQDIIQTSLATLKGYVPPFILHMKEQLNQLIKANYSEEAKKVELKTPPRTLNESPKIAPQQPSLPQV
jgi:hypothetical protein